MSKAITQGVHHVGLTVPNIQKTCAFFVDTLGFSKVGEKQDYPAVFVSDGVTMITLWQVKDAKRQVTFDRKNVVGLHHFALGVANTETLESLKDKLEQAIDVFVEFTPENLGAGPTKHMMCTIPGGVRLEFIALAN